MAYLGNHKVIDYKTKVDMRPVVEMLLPSLCVEMYDLVDKSKINIV